MKTRDPWKLLSVMVLLALLFSSPAVLLLGRDGFEINWYVVNVGGGYRGSENYVMLSQLGQPFNGHSASPDRRYRIYHGWVGHESPLDDVLEVIDIQGPMIPDGYALLQNYPNPFNPSTVIAFSLKRSGHTTLEVLDILGRRVITLTDRYLASGPKRVLWDGCDDRGKQLASGVYFYRLRTAEWTQTRKMLLLK